MNSSVTAAVLTAALVHAIWNAIAHGIKDQLLAFGLIGVGGIAVAIPLVIISPLPHKSCWPYLLASVAIHVLYNLGLMRAYRYGEFSQVYPLARGTSPLVVTILAALFVHERPSPVQLAGVLVVSTGLAVLVLGGRRPGRAAFLAAVGTGLTIAAYTTVDGVGVRASGTSVAYIGWLMLLESLGVPLWALIMRRSVLAKQPAAIIAAGLLAGALSVLAYGLVLWAQTRGALAPIAALRETSVIFGAIIGTVAFREPFGRTRIAATIIVSAGIILLNVPLRAAARGARRSAERNVDRAGYQQPGAERHRRQRDHRERERPHASPDAGQPGQLVGIAGPPPASAQFEDGAYPAEKQEPRARVREHSLGRRAAQDRYREHGTAGRQHGQHTVRVAHHQQGCHEQHQGEPQHRGHVPRREQPG